MVSRTLDCEDCGIRTAKAVRVDNIYHCPRCMNEIGIACTETAIKELDDALIKFRDELFKVLRVGEIAAWLCKLFNRREVE